jgi:cell division protein ZapA
MEKVKTIVKIAGKEYLMAGYESEEYMHRVAIYVDRKMEELEQTSFNLNSTMLAVLAAANIADELLKLQDEIPAMQDRISQLKEELRALQKENVLLRENRKSNISSISEAKKTYDNNKYDICPVRYRHIMRKLSNPLIRGLRLKSCQAPAGTFLWKQTMKHIFTIYHPSVIFIYISPP